MKNNIVMSIDQSKAVLLFRLVLSAAFDTADHHDLCIQLGKLFGLLESVLDWFTSYVNERSQRVSIQSVLSDTLSSQFGIPQG